ncbi:hypothetical protein PI125_g18300 [Phytophthora idaei]|nr:hypothetical protein PI125_g18300 [Phytophthora idaei]
MIDTSGVLIMLVRLQQRDMKFWKQTQSWWQREAVVRWTQNRLDCIGTQKSSCTFALAGGANVGKAHILAVKYDFVTNCKALVPSVPIKSSAQALLCSCHGVLSFHKRCLLALDKAGCAGIT